MNKDELINQFSSEANTGVQFGGLFSTLTLFFSGLLISNYNSFPSYVRVPLLFLILSTFGFVYATLIYANATSLLNSDSIKSCSKALNTADILSEFFGVYALLVAIPLVIPVVTNDIFLIFSVFVTDVAGMVIYHISRYSVILEYFPKTHFLIIGITILLMLMMLVLLKSDLQIPLLILVSTTITLLAGISFYATKKINLVR